MVEIILSIVGHPDSFHDPTRANIVYCSKRNDFLESHALKTKGQGCTCSLLSIPLTPAVECQPPTNFHTGRERQWMAWYVKSDKTDEAPWFSAFGSPESEAVSFNPLLDR